MPPTTTPKRHLFTQSELESYFNRISFPKDSRIYNVSHLSEAEKLTFLNLLQSYQLVAVPWENVTQHYSWHRVVHISPRHLFRKIVDNPGRGGYCMEVNYFFHHILYSLGFDTYMCGSRIFNTGSGKFGGWTHVVNLVRIGGKKYLCDGGYGAPGESCRRAGYVEIARDPLGMKGQSGETSWYLKGFKVPYGMEGGIDVLRSL